jgi:hypothetical protein
MTEHVTFLPMIQVSTGQQFKRPRPPAGLGSGYQQENGFEKIQEEIEL